MSEYVLYCAMDGDLMVYVGVARQFRFRLNKHLKDAADSRHAWRPLYQLLMQRQSENRPLMFAELQTFPDKRSALIAERDLIAQHGIIEDGGPLLNTRRSGIGPAGYTKDALAKMSEAAKQAHQDPEYAKQIRERAQRMAADPAQRAEQSRKLKEHWADPDARAKALAIQHSDDVQAKRAVEMKRRWADPAFREKMAKRRPRTWTDEARATHGDKCRATLKRKQEE